MSVWTCTRGSTDRSARAPSTWAAPLRRFRLLDPQTSREYAQEALLSLASLVDAVPPRRGTTRIDALAAQRLRACRCAEPARAVLLVMSDDERTAPRLELDALAGPEERELDETLDVGAVGESAWLVKVRDRLALSRCADATLGVTRLSTLGSQHSCCSDTQLRPRAMEQAARRHRAWAIPAHDSRRVRVRCRLRSLIPCSQSQEMAILLPDTITKPNTADEIPGEFELQIANSSSRNLFVFGERDVTDQPGQPRSRRASSCAGCMIADTRQDIRRSAPRSSTSATSRPSSAAPTSRSCKSVASSPRRPNDRACFGHAACLRDCGSLAVSRAPVRLPMFAGLTHLARRAAAPLWLCLSAAAFWMIIGIASRTDIDRSASLAVP